MNGGSMSYPRLATLRTPDDVQSHKFRFIFAAEPTNIMYRIVQDGDHPLQHGNVGPEGSFPLVCLGRRKGGLRV
jgi:hypothetical protein